MKKDRYSAIIVVEGQTDKALIASFLDAEVVTVNGSAVSRETLEYLQKASETREIVVLTDPDSPGKRIRDVIASFVPGVKHAFIPKEKAIKRGKVGVAESDKDTILDALKNLVPNNPKSQGTLVYSDLLSLSLVGPGSRENREKIAKKFHLGHCNGKTLLQRLNALNISIQELKEAL